MIRISDKLWLVLSTFFANAMRIGTTLVVARWVSRDDYGLFTIIVTLQGIISLGDMNLPASWIQMNDDDGVLRDTATILVTVFYLLYGLILTGCCIYLTHTHHDWRLWLAGLLTAITFMMNALYTLRLAELNKRLHFAAESKQNFIYAIAQGSTGIVFALCGLGIFALVLQSFVGQVAATIAIGGKAPFRMPRRFSWAGAKRMLGLGGKVTASTYVSNFAVSTTTLTINHAQGNGAAGDFGRGMGVLLLFAQNLLYGLERVAYPTLCKAVGDPVRMRDLVTRVTTMLLMCAGFTGAWLFATREDLVRLGLGAQWGNVPGLLKLLAVAVPAWAIYITSYHSIYAMGKTGVLLVTSAISAAACLIGLVVVHNWGIPAIVWAWIAAQFLMAILNFVWVAVVIRPPVAEILGRGALFVETGVAAGVIMRLIYYHLYWMNTFIRFSLCSAAGLAVYGVLVLITQRGPVEFAWRMAKARKEPAVTAPMGGSTEFADS